MQGGLFLQFVMPFVVFWLVTSCSLVSGQQKISENSYLKMKATCSSETLLATQKNTRRHSPEEKDGDFHRTEHTESQNCRHLSVSHVNKSVADNGLVRTETKFDRTAKLNPLLFSGLERGNMPMDRRHALTLCCPCSAP